MFNIMSTKFLMMLKDQKILLFKKLKIFNHIRAQTHRTLEHIYSAKYLIPPADPLLKRTSVPKIVPKFGKMKNFIKLPVFMEKNL